MYKLIFALLFSVALISCEDAINSDNNVLVTKFENYSVIYTKIDENDESQSAIWRSRAAMDENQIFIDNAILLSEPQSNKLIYHESEGGEIKGAYLYDMATENKKLVGSSVSGDIETFYKLSPDGTRYMKNNTNALDRPGELYVADTETSNETLISDQTNIELAHFSPDGQKIAYTVFPGFTDSGFQFSDVVVANSDGSGKKILHKSDSVAVVGWSPDGSELLCQVMHSYAEKNSIALMDAENGELTILKTYDKDQVMAHPVFSPDGTKIALFANDMDLAVMNPDGSNFEIIVDNHGKMNSIDLPRIKWHKDSRHLIYQRTPNHSSGDISFANVEIVDTQTGAAEVIEGQTNVVRAFWILDKE